MRCTEISADWAAQRIKGLSLFSALKNAIIPKSRTKNRKDTIKTLIETFRYPRKGPGMLWTEAAKKIQQKGGSIFLGNRVYRCEYHANESQWHVYFYDKEQNIQKMIASHVISSAPLRDFVLDYLWPLPSQKISESARQLQYRDFLIVVLILKDRNLFSDNWIYVHDANVDVARIQNFKSWSPEMVPDENMCCYGMEYFCFKDDATWSLSNDALIQKATAEIVKLGLAKYEDIVDGSVVRQTKAYPVYDQHYQINVEIIRRALEEQYPTLYLVGRNGMHKYNNQDHAMMTAMLTVKNILAGHRRYDVWNVNQDAEYHEEGVAGEVKTAFGLRQVPEKIS